MSRLVPVNGGRYLREVEYFGRGAFGMVHEALPATPRPDTSPVVYGSRRLCLKLVDLPASGLSAEHQEEIRVWSSLDHPNVAPLRDWFVDSVSVLGTRTSKKLGLVTDLYERGSLRAVLDRDIEERALAEGERRPPKPFLTPRRVFAIAHGVLAGLDFLHSKTSLRPSIVHRDLKPENVCLGVGGSVDGVEGPDGRQCRVFASEESLEVRIIDFGLSLERFDTRFSGGSLGHGTPMYMGPQRVADQSRYSGRADDCWAAGLVFAECLLGEGISRLFPSVRELRLTDSPDVIRPKLPSCRMEEVESVILRCELAVEHLGKIIRGLLIFDEEERWTSSHALGELEASTAGLGRLLRGEAEARESEHRAKHADLRSRVEEVERLVESLNAEFEDYRTRIALTAATEAISVAREALEKADSALVAAAAADRRAEEAEGKAESAMRIADEAKIDSAEAKERADEASRTSEETRSRLDELIRRIHPVPPGPIAVVGPAIRRSSTAVEVPSKKLFEYVGRAVRSGLGSKTCSLQWNDPDATHLRKLLCADCLGTRGSW